MAEAKITVKAEDLASEVLKQVAARLQEMGATATTSGEQTKSVFDQVGVATIAMGTAIGEFVGTQLVRLADKLVEVAGTVVDFARESAFAGARLEQLAGVAGYLAERAGYSRDAITGLADQMQRTGITGEEAYNAIIQLTRYNIDLTDALALQSAAQNSAAIAGKSSSETLGLLIQGIVTLQPELLRSAGYTVSLKQEMQEWAKATGQAQTELTGAQKQQLLLNEVIQQATEIQGVYNLSMEFAAKQATSAERAWAQAAEQLGLKLLPVTVAVYTGMYDLGTAFRDGIRDSDELSIAIKGIGDAFLAAFDSTTEDRAKAIDKTLASVALGSLDLGLALTQVGTVGIAAFGALQTIGLSFSQVFVGVIATVFEAKASLQEWLAAMPGADRAMTNNALAARAAADGWNAMAVSLHNEALEAMASVTGHSALNQKLDEMGGQLFVARDRLLAASVATDDNTRAMSAFVGPLNLVRDATGAIATTTPEATKAQQEWARVLHELNTAGATWRTTLNQIDGEIVAAVQYYLQAGVSAGTLAKAYDLTQTQIRAVSDSLKASKPEWDAWTTGTLVAHRAAQDFSLVLPTVSSGVAAMGQPFRDLESTLKDFGVITLPHVKSSLDGINLTWQETMADVFSPTVRETIEETSQGFLAIADAFGGMGEGGRIAGIALQTVSGVINNLAEGDLLGAVVAGISGLATALAGIGGPAQEELDARKLQITLIDQLRESFTQTMVAQAAATSGGKIYADLLAAVQTSYEALGKSGAEADAQMKLLLNTHDINEYKGAVDDFLIVWQQYLDINKNATIATTQFGAALDITATAITQLKADQAALATATGADLAAITASMQTQTGIIAATMLHSQEAASAMSASLVGAFDLLIQNGASFSTALVQIEPMLKDLQVQLDATGFDGGAAFAFLQTQIALASHEIAGPALTSVQSLAAGMDALSKTGHLTQQEFSGLASQITATYQSLVTQGQDGRAVLVAMQGPLQTLFELQDKFGLKVDESTQALIIEAQQAGLVGAAHKSSTQQMIDGLNNVVIRLGDIGTALGATLTPLSNLTAGLATAANSAAPLASSLSDVASRASSIPRGPVDGLRESMGWATTPTEAVSRGLTDIVSRAGSVPRGAIDQMRDAMGSAVTPTGDVSRGLADIVYRAGSMPRGSIDQMRDALGSAVSPTSDVSRGLADIVGRAASIPQGPAWDLANAMGAVARPASDAAREIASVQSTTWNLNADPVWGTARAWDTARGETQNANTAISDVRTNLTTVPTNINWRYYISLQHEGGLIAHEGLVVPKAHDGLALDERLIVAQTGEGILSRADMAALGGKDGFDALRRDLHEVRTSTAGPMLTTATEATRGTPPMLAQEIRSVALRLDAALVEQQTLMRMLPKWIRDAIATS